MTETLERIKTQIADLGGSILSSIQHDLEHKTVVLTFDLWDGRKIILACVVTIHCDVSADGPDGNNEVIRATVKPIAADVFRDLDKIGYLWKLNPDEVADDFEGLWLNLSIHGDTCVEIVCRELDID